MATRPGESDVPSAGKRRLLRRFLASRGEIRPLVSGVIAAGFVLVILVLVLELVVILLSLWGIDVFEYLLGASMFAWLAHRIYL